MFLVQLFSCRESIECFPGIDSRYVHSPLVTISVARDYQYDKTFHVPHALNLYNQIFVLLSLSSSLSLLLLLLLLLTAIMGPDLTNGVHY
jgi:hypothetical protein